MKRFYTTFTFLLFGIYTGNLFAQNLFPTAKNSNITIDGGGIEYLSPVKTGGWARGIGFYNSEGTVRSFGFGVYGSGTEARRLYITYKNDNEDLYLSKNGIHMLPNGFVGIGTTSPQARLTVNGNVLAKEVKIKTDISVPDYVFDPDYELTSLSEIEAYVKVHRHLPEVPSAADIEKDGLDLAEMNLLLLKKVEELTLHLIEREKENKQLQKEMTDVRQRIKVLEEGI